MPRRPQNYNRDKALLGKTLEALNRLIVKFDHIADFRLNIVACVLYGISVKTHNYTCNNNRIYGDKAKRIVNSVQGAEQFLASNPDFKNLIFSDFVIRLQEHFKSFRIVLFAHDSIKPQFIGSGVPNADTQDLNLYLRESGDKGKLGLFNILNYPAAFFKFRHICPHCLTFTNSKKKTHVRVQLRTL